MGFTASSTPATPQPAKRAFTEKEASHYISMSTSFLRHARMDGAREDRIPGPRFIKLGSRAIRYLKEDLDAWLEQFQKLDHLAQLSLPQGRK